MKFLAIYLRRRRLSIGMFFLFCLIFLAAFLLYELPAGAVLYPALVCSLIGILVLSMDFAADYRKHLRLQELLKLPASLMESLPEVKYAEDEDYQQIIEHLRREQQQLENQMSRRYADMVDYYTVWVHQIKTPIASMRLKLQNEDSLFSREVSEDLFRIEQYVEMVLVFLRLDSNSTDYVIRSQDLDVMIRQGIRKFSSQFIYRKIRLVYEPFHTKVITDEKWLLFVIEQVLSNALKYTPSGGTITIELEEPKTLCIRDTGIGIAPEDLPRIFQKGYTGYNGRSDKKASGIGLYLCQRICRNLGHPITARSVPDRGTEIRIDLDQKKLEVE